VAPTITARTPASGARSVSQTANITATFSEPVANVSAGTVVLRLNGSAAPIPASVIYNNATRTVTLNPNATLLPDRTYNMAFSSIRDTAGNPLAPSGWQFTTGPAPTVVSASPANRAVGVRRTANVTIRFSEPVATPTTGTVVLRLGTSVIPAVVTYNAATRTATLNPSATLLANRTYTMAVSVRDLVGNPTTTPPWTFTTGSAL
jgi:methionine-rich copper-binding protein CopC